MIKKILTLKNYTFFAVFEQNNAVEISNYKIPFFLISITVFFFLHSQLKTRNQVLNENGVSFCTLCTSLYDEVVVWCFHELLGTEELFIP